MAWLAIGLAGALGALARYGLSGWVHRFAGPDFPAGTLAVNLAGCFVLGLLTELARHVGWVSPEVRVWVGIGFLGAFTTFSTFGVETFRAAEAGDWHGVRDKYVTLRRLWRDSPSSRRSGWRAGRNAGR